MKFLILLLTLVSTGLANDGSAEILVPEDMPQDMIPAQNTPFITMTKAYKAQLEELEYSARRHSWHFGYNEIETMKAISHLLRLADDIVRFGETDVRGKEAFYQMKQPLTYVSQFLPYNPLFSHVVSTWDKSLQIYSKMVELHTGMTPAPTPPVDFNDPKLKKLQADMRDLKDTVEMFQHQLKNGLIQDNIENSGLIAYVDQFSIFVGKMHANSYSFVTQKYELEKNLMRALQASKQITAIVLYHPNGYVKDSWQTIKDKANIARVTFEELMQPSAASLQ